MVSLLPITSVHSSFIKSLAQDAGCAEFFRSYPPLQVWPEDVSGWFGTGYVIRSTITEEYLGIISTCNIDSVTKQLEFGIVISDQLCDNRRDSMLLALQLFVDYLFNYLQFNKVYCKVLTHRKSLRDFMESHKFRLDGTLRESTFYKGQLQDECLYSLLKKEYL